METNRRRVYSVSLVHPSSVQITLSFTRPFSVLFTWFRKPFTEYCTDFCKIICLMFDYAVSIGGNTIRRVINYPSVRAAVLDGPRMTGSPSQEKQHVPAFPNERLHLLTKYFTHWRYFKINYCDILQNRLLAENQSTSWSLMWNCVYVDGPHTQHTRNSLHLFIWSVGGKPWPLAPAARLFAPVWENLRKHVFSESLLENFERIGFKQTAWCFRFRFIQNVFHFKIKAAGSRRDGNLGRGKK